jgi:nitrogen regulatory protein PII
MRRITAIVRPTRLDPVLCALDRAGVECASVSPARGFGRQKGRAELHRGTGFAEDLVAKLRVECAVPDDLLMLAVGALVRAARTGRIGDGKVWIEHVQEAHES